MAQQNQQQDRTKWPAGSEAGQGGEHFKREGPAPATEDTGRTVDEMNRKAEESVITNVTPDQVTD